jgi:hypothetical protein
MLIKIAYFFLKLRESHVWFFGVRHTNWEGNITTLQIGLEVEYRVHRLF